MNPDLLQGGRLDDVSLRADLKLGSELSFSGTAQYEWWNFPLLAANTRSNVAVSISMSYRPKKGLRTW